MVPVPDEAFRALAAAFGLDPPSLRLLGGGSEASDGVVFATPEGPGRRVLKILAATQPDASRRADMAVRVGERAKFFAYLGANGIPVVSPVPGREGRLLAQADLGNVTYLAYSYPFLPGTALEPGMWEDPLIEEWGALVGRTHRLTRGYGVWDGVDSPSPGRRLLDWREELDYFRDECADAEVREAWDSLRNRMEPLAVGRSAQGMVHNDAHAWNLLLHGGRLGLIDFDSANCHFFASDIATALSPVLFVRTGGMERPLEDPEGLRRFSARWLAGYRRENDLPDGTRGALALFAQYRRVLLFTVMQEGLRRDPDGYARWKNMILEEPALPGLEG